MNLLLLNPIACHTEDEPYKSVHTVIMLFHANAELAGYELLATGGREPNRPILEYRAAPRNGARLSLMGCIAWTLNARRSSSSIAACW
jgi:hypothetical protein